MRGEKEKLENAVGKYREKMEEQKKSLKQFQDNENLLTAELKKEMKLKEEKEMKLKKGEEKLKKKERLLEEEQAAREKAEKEVKSPCIFIGFYSYSFSGGTKKFLFKNTFFGNCPKNPL